MPKLDQIYTNAKVTLDDPNATALNKIVRVRAYIAAIKAFPTEDQFHVMSTRLLRTLRTAIEACADENLSKELGVLQNELKKHLVIAKENHPNLEAPQADLEVLTQADIDGIYAAELSRSINRTSRTARAPKRLHPGQLTGRTVHWKDDTGPASQHPHKRARKKR